MKNYKYPHILIASLAQCLFFLFPMSGNTGFLWILVYLCPIPIMYIGIRYDWKHSALTAIISSLFVYYADYKLAIFNGLVFCIPSIYLCYLLMLNKLNPKTEERSWFPISLLITNILKLGMSLLILLIIYIGPGFEEYISRLSLFYSSAFEVRPDLEQIINLSTMELIAYTLPVLFILFFILIFIMNIWLSLKLTKANGHLRRPHPNFHNINLPNAYIYYLLISLAGSFIGFGIIKVLCITFSFGLLLCYSINGLSILHYVTIGMNLRPLILVIVYTLIIIFIPFIVPLTILGILDYNNQMRYKINFNRR